MMVKTFNIVGYGELIFDHLFVEDNSGVIYKGSRGGGSVWNLLANLSSRGLFTKGVGCSGNDAYGRFARSELEELGVDVSEILLVPSMATRVIFQLTRKSADLFQPPQHTFSAKCIVCSHTPSVKTIARAARHIETKKWNLRSESILCLDRFTRDREDLILAADHNNVISVIDLGVIGYLRWISSVRTLGYLALFDIVQIPSPVALSLKGRARLDFKEFLNTGRTKILIITQGEMGITTFVKRKNGAIVKSNKAEILDVRYGDTAGSGDTFLAAFLDQMILGYDTKLFSIKKGASPELVSEAVTKALCSFKPVLEVFGARGHLPEPRLGRGVSELTAFREMRLADIRAALNEMEHCPFCGALVHEGKRKTATRTLSKKPHVGIRKNMAKFLKRVLWSIEKREAIRECINLINGIKTGYVVGTGGSYPSATFVAQLLSMHKGKFMQAAKPLEYCKTGSKSDCLIVISYSGETKDCEKAINHAITMGVARIGLVTASDKPRLGNLLRRDGSDIVISYGKHWGKERGFVSIAGTVSPCALWTAAMSSSVDVVTWANRIECKIDGFTYIEEISDLLRRNEVLHVFGSGMALPALLDIESKLAEGGLGTAQLHESKDFAHGRFMLVFSHRQVKNPKLLIRNGAEDTYEDRLEETLRKQGPLLVLASQDPGPFGALELLIEVQFLIQRIATALDIDISRPAKIPKEGLKLYKW